MFPWSECDIYASLRPEGHQPKTHNTPHLNIWVNIPTNMLSECYEAKQYIVVFSFSLDQWIR